MDGSPHRERTEITVRATDVPDPFPDEHPKDAASVAGDAHDSSSKRPHEGEDDESAAKRTHLETDEPEDLDLDALLAQLQQHTDRVKMDNAAATDPEPADATGDGPEQPAQAVDNELSIEQQLKGALSSLQALEGGEDEYDEDESAALAIDQLSNILKSSEKPAETAEEPQEPSASGVASETSEKRVDAGSEGQEAPKDTASVQTQGVDEHTSLEQPHDARDVATETAVGHVHGDVDSTVERADQHADQALDPALDPALDRALDPALDPTLSETARADAGDAEPRPGRAESEDSSTSSNKHESLLAKMPPPPSQGAGPLPPMPPPPAAFTSPTAPLTALELTRGSQMRAPTSLDLDSRSIDARIHRIHRPTFSEVPAHSKSYEASIAEQVDKAVTDSEGKDESVTGLLLNDSQSILQSRERCILLLDALACQVLDFLSFSHYQETLATVMQPDSERGMAYRMLLDAFEDVKRMYLKWKTQSSRLKPEPKPDEVRPFLPYNLPGVEPTRENLTTLQRANMATFVAAVFGTIEIGFWELDKWFLKVFVPINGRLFKQQATIYLDLKTQAYISAVESTEDVEVHQEAIEHLFPKDLEAKIQDILGERVSLAPSEQDFVEKCHRRRDNILAEDKHNLSTKYHWVPFLRELSDYISRNHYTLMPRRKLFIAPSEGTQHNYASSTSSRSYAPMRSSSESRTGSRRSPLTAVGPSSATAGANNDHTNDDDGEVQVSSVQRKDSTGVRDPKVEIDDKDTDGEGSRTPAAASSSSGSKRSGSVDAQTADAEQNSDKAEERKQHPDIPAEGHPLFPPLPKQVLPPPSNASLPGNGEFHPQGAERPRRPGPRAHSEAPVAANSPTDTLAVYEAAKASAEGTDAIRPKTSMFTTRRVWTKEEEEALLKGMDRVQGPYWAQILELYGPGGKISEVLKDRTQVQLKDKARNLKMFFVRLGLPIPAVFQYVTGDYETRRSSGKKIRDRKQQQAGPSSLSQELRSQADPVHNPAVSANPSKAAVPLPAAPLPAASSQLDHSAPTNTSLGSENKIASGSNENAGSLEQTNKNIETSTSPLLAADSESSQTLPPQSNSEQARAGESATTPANVQSSEPATADRFNNPREEETTAPGAASLSQAGQTITGTDDRPAGTEPKEPNHSSADVILSSQPPHKAPADDAEGLSSGFGDSGDRQDDDLSSLLNRVGEYVENH